MTVPYILAPEADRDVAEIADYIARDDPDAALRVVSEIHEVALRLAKMPHIGHQRADLTDQPMRFGPI